MSVTQHRQALRLSDVCERTRLGKSWIYAALSRGDFPKPFKLTGKAIAWDEAEIDAWLEARIAERDAR